MSDIYDERDDYKSPKLLTQQLHRHYISILRRDVTPARMDQDELRRSTELATNWPGDELVAQLIGDAVRLMSENGVGISDMLRRL